MQYTISGSNFGADAAASSTADGVLRSLELLTGNYSCPAGQTYILLGSLGCQPFGLGLPGVLGEQWAAAGDASRALYQYS